MRKRTLHTLLFAIPGLIAALIVTALLVGTGMGMLWLFVYGDGPWPPVIGTVAGILIPVIFLTLWLATAWAGYQFGRARESEPSSDKTAILISTGVTAALLVLIALHQFRVGNLGPPHPSQVCSQYCLGQGYSASSLSPANAPPRICYCLGEEGQVIQSSPLESLAVDD